MIKNTFYEIENMILAHKYILDIFNYRIKDEGIKGLTNLTSLNLSYNRVITDEVIKSLTSLKQIFK